MKSTDMARRDRELKRSQKKQEVLGRKQDKKQDLSIGDFINLFHKAFFFDQEKIYNTQQSEELLELLEDMKKQLPAKEWENVLRKAIRKTQVRQREEAFKELMELLGE